MKTIDVWVDSGLTIDIPDSIDIKNLDDLTVQENNLLGKIARQKLIGLIQSPDRYIDFTYENPEEN